MELVHFYQRIELDDEVRIVSSYLQGKNAQIEITYNFSNQDVPSDTDITIHGISKKTASKFKVGSNLSIYAGFYNADFTENNISHLLTASITTVDAIKWDSGDWYLHLTIQDGTKVDPKKALKVAQSKQVRAKSTNKSSTYRTQMRNFENNAKKRRQAWLNANPNATRHQKHLNYVQIQNSIKAYRTQLKGAQSRATEKSNKQKTYRVKTVYKNMSFKAGTKGSTIIKTLANKAGIKISELKLVYNHVYYSGYTAKKKPLSCIQDIAKDCKTDMFYQHGKLVIKSFVSNKHLNYTCVPKTGLITSPSLSTDEDNKDVYEATILFNPIITTGVIFRIDDKFSGFTDDVIVTNGNATLSNSDTPTMTINFKKLSQYKKEQASEIKKAKSDDAKAKSKLDAKRVKQAKSKRTNRKK